MESLVGWLLRPPAAPGSLLSGLRCLPTHTFYIQSPPSPTAAPANGPSPEVEFCGDTQRTGRQATSVGELQGEGEKGRGFGAILLQILVLSFAKMTTVPSRIVTLLGQ